MSSGTFYRASGVRHSKSLLSRGGLARTFGSLAGFLVLLFLFCGFYILADAFTNPIQAGAVALIAAAFILALAAILLFFLFKPRNRLPRAGHWPHEAPSSKASSRPLWQEEIPGSQKTQRQFGMLLDSPARPFPQDTDRRDLAYQRLYVDQSRVRR